MNIPNIPSILHRALRAYGTYGTVGIDWTWDHSSREEHISVDNYLLAIKHPLAYRAGTAEGRFEYYTKELAAKSVHD